MVIQKPNTNKGSDIDTAAKYYKQRGIFSLFLNSRYLLYIVRA